MKIHVGNLSDEISEDDIRQAFEKSGAVESVLIVKNKYNGQSKMFAFVVMNSDEEGKSAIDSLDGKELKGRTLKVGEALADGGHGGKGGFGGKGEFGGKRGPGGAKGGIGGSKGFSSGKGGFGGKKSFGGGRGGRGR
ncbi:MAG: RNA-binding protein [Candidatus Scalindua rubra]|uniref:Rna binding protein n=1 Tax=Candidatus Scalindua brodae TaxID=237368 RepID=A0A0B0EDR6_9BACT|nr:MAG: rna binding protein [Candidatus Scalindua brodae]MBZ0110563.1 RNA-binding protein [Candidatus Scalindua rubra]